MIRFCLPYFFESKAIPNPYSFLMKKGFTSNVASRCVTGNVTQLKLSHISALCTALHCTPNDLLEWVPDKGEPLPAGHPLHALVRSEPIDIVGQVKHLSYKQLEEVQALIKKMNSPE
jgi:hypothetical protein